MLVVATVLFVARPQQTWLSRFCLSIVCWEWGHLQVGKDLFGWFCSRSDFRFPACVGTARLHIWPCGRDQRWAAIGTCLCRVAQTNTHMLTRQLLNILPAATTPYLWTFKELVVFQAIFYRPNITLLNQQCCHLFFSFCIDCHFQSLCYHFWQFLLARQQNAGLFSFFFLIHSPFKNKCPGHIYI